MFFLIRTDTQNYITDAQEIEEVEPIFYKYLAIANMKPQKIEKIEQVKIEIMEEADRAQFINPHVNKVIIND